MRTCVLPAYSAAVCFLAPVRGASQAPSVSSFCREVSISVISRRYVGQDVPLEAAIHFMFVTSLAPHEEVLQLLVN